MKQLSAYCIVVSIAYAIHTWANKQLKAVRFKYVLAFWPPGIKGSISQRRNCFLKRVFFLRTLLFIVLIQYTWGFFVNLSHINQNKQKRLPVHSDPSTYFTLLDFPIISLIKTPVVLDQRVPWIGNIHVLQDSLFCRKVLRVR